MGSWVLAWEVFLFELRAHIQWSVRPCWRSQELTWFGRPSTTKINTPQQIETNKVCNKHKDLCSEPPRFRQHKKRRRFLTTTVFGKGSVHLKHAETIWQSEVWTA